MSSRIVGCFKVTQWVNTSINKNIRSAGHHHGAVLSVIDNECLGHLLRDELRAPKHRKLLFVMVMPVRHRFSELHPPVRHSHANLVRGHGPQSARVLPRCAGYLSRGLGENPCLYYFESGFIEEFHRLLPELRNSRSMSSLYLKFSVFPGSGSCEQHIPENLAFRGSRKTKPMGQFGSHVQLSHHILAFQEKEFEGHYSPYLCLCPVHHYTKCRGYSW